MHDPKVIVALDYANMNHALAFAEKIEPGSCRLKVGKEMFTLFGPALIKQLHAGGHEVFLDLKFHDIPNTCARAVAAAAELGVWMVNVHAAGGERMMVAAREALVPYGGNRPWLIGVTVLTSMTAVDLADSGIQISPQAQVQRLAGLTQQAGLDGVVCSAQEASLLKAQCGDAFKLVTPGIRPAGSDKGDQRRVMTPEQAVQAGSDYLVIGRPVTKAADPAAVLASINQSLNDQSAE
ncbi:orotidine 5'-phosphate decarboxylase [Salinivibrio siamensis]|uniref:Orotidine 5'-phosphate decarboxylase n=1 Tax=Salinivibrio siamensis TaxID=414286 RepID=A0ABX3K861_9GAMM|nr:orotidine-5'-phosphate decarboxylase [Salinivibrio siamensis]OOE84558.1 orotidine 5'-phosphate decarboxylase [Salinivibrio siamensis]